MWAFDPQDIAYHPQQWWWDPLRAIREVPDPHRVEAAARLAGHFMATIGGTRRDPFFHAAGEQVLTGTLLAAALDPTASLREVVEWLQHGRRDAITALDTAGADTEAADLEAALAGADVTAKGIFQTARTATKALTSRADPALDHPTGTPGANPAPTCPSSTPGPSCDHTPATLHLLSKEGAGTAAPVVAALVDRILEVAELTAQARGGRLDPPVVAVLDEAANICPIRDTAPALQPLRLPRHPGPHHAAELPTRRRGLGQPRHGRPLVGRHRQTRRRRRRRPPLPRPPVRADRRPRRRAALHQPRPRTRPLPPVLHHPRTGPARLRPCARCPKTQAVLLATGRRAGLERPAAPGTANPTPPTSPAAPPPR